MHLVGALEDCSVCGNCNEFLPAQEPRYNKQRVTAMLWHAAVGSGAYLTSLQVQDNPVLLLAANKRRTLSALSRSQWQAAALTRAAGYNDTRPPRVLRYGRQISNTVRVYRGRHVTRVNELCGIFCLCEGGGHMAQVLYGTVLAIPVVYTPRCRVIVI
ncbi:hypothetical protein J6590_027629 [Homalodisca vitripennis]|nr:hypothetical protein J6590_027629 [Homalodisca vitripennis]